MEELNTLELRGVMIFDGENYHREVPLMLDFTMSEDADPRFMTQAVRVLSEGTQERYKAMLEDEEVQTADWN